MRNLFICLCLVLSIFSCASENQDSTDKVLSLNNGLKWKANKETSQGVSNMLDLVNKSLEKESLSIEDCEALSVGLKKEYQFIFKNCTMTGPAHEQLHNFLTPILRHIKTLKSEDQLESKNALQSLQIHLVTYVEYFQ